MADAKVRLYVEHRLGAGQSIPLTPPQAHHPKQVMRLGEGDALLVFDGRSGEFRARVAQAGRSGGRLVCEARTAPLALPPDLWLAFAPIRKERTAYIVEKATEMGVRRILPVRTEFTSHRLPRPEKLRAHAIEAAEQCGGTFLPELAPEQPLAALLERLPADRHLMFCDEALAGQGRGLEGAPAGPWLILIGPVGGFSPAERARIAAMPRARAVSLGPRILRADTAAVAAMALWQTRLGDW